LTIVPAPTQESSVTRGNDGDQRETASIFGIVPDDSPCDENEHVEAKFQAYCLALYLSFYASIESLASSEKSIRYRPSKFVPMRI
jgi:hypothetical protein